MNANEAWTDHWVAASGRPEGGFGKNPKPGKNRYGARADGNGGTWLGGVLQTKLAQAVEEEVPAQGEGDDVDDL